MAEKKSEKATGHTPTRAEMEASAKRAEEKMRNMTKEQQEALARAWNGMDVQEKLAKKRKTSGGKK